MFISTALGIISELVNCYSYGFNGSKCDLTKINRCFYAMFFSRSYFYSPESQTQIRHKKDLGYTFIFSLLLKQRKNRHSEIMILHIIITVPFVHEHTSFA